MSIAKSERERPARSGLRSVVCGACPSLPFSVIACLPSVHCPKFSNHTWHWKLGWKRTTATEQFHGIAGDGAIQATAIGSDQNVSFMGS